MPEEAQDLIGGRYLLAEPVSQGGLGRIWRGHDQLLDREVAVTEISLPPRQGADRADVADAIMREVRAAARLSGRGGIVIHDVAEHADALWVVTQPGEGESLDAEITRIGRLSGQRAAGGEASTTSTAGPGRPASGTATLSARASQGTSALPGPGSRGVDRLAAVMRANPGLAVGVATGIVMILALLLVVVLFPSHHRPASPPGRPTVTSTGR